MSLPCPTIYLFCGPLNSNNIMLRILSWILAIGLILLIASCAKPTEPQDLPDDNGTSSLPYPSLHIGTDSTFEIGTWNLLNYPHASTSNVYITDILKSLDVDMVCFQEISNSLQFANMVNLLNDIDSVNTWVGHVGNSTNYDGQDLAVIYKADIISQIEFTDIFTNESGAFPRSPLKIKFTLNDETFIVIDNHLKAYDSQEDRDRRKNACSLLDTYIDSTYPNDNVIILGDMNDEVTDGSSENVFLAFIDSPGDYKIADMIIARGSSQNWSYPTWPSHIDHIIITNELFDEFSGSGAAINTIRIDDALDGGWYEYETNISDHRPVVWSFPL